MNSIGKKSAILNSRIAGKKIMVAVTNKLSSKDVFSILWKPIKPKLVWKSSKKN